MREYATVDVGDDENKRDGAGGGTDHDCVGEVMIYKINKIKLKCLCMLTIIS